MEIFGYLPTYKDISLVNKLFYSIVCKMNDSNICVRIDQRFFERFFCDNLIDSQCLLSIQASKRQISKVEIGGSYLRYFGHTARRSFVSSIISILERFPATIKSLKYADVIMDESTFLEILSLTPDVEHLDLQYLSLHMDHQPSKRIRRNNNDVNLKKLTLLSFLGCDKEFVTVFNRLPAGILTELRITDIHWRTITDVLSRQLNIRDLKLERIWGDDGTADIFDRLNLESLELHGFKFSSDTIVAMISKQARLKSLTVSAGAVDGRVVTAVADNVELEMLSMDVTETPAASIAELKSLKKLKELTLRFYDGEATAKLKALARLDNTSIVKLRLKGFFTMPADLCNALLKSVPNLKHLHVCPTNYLKSTELDAVMSHFNFVEVLEVNVLEKPLLETGGHYFNAKLSELAIVANVVEGLLCKPWLTKLTASYPNLRKLQITIEGRQPNNSFEIRPILDGFTKLESLSLEASATKLIVEDSDCLQDRKNSLKFVSLRSAH